MTEQNKVIDISFAEVEAISTIPTPYEPIRHYTPLTAGFMLDWNKLLYSVEEEEGYQLDWNRLIYNEDQIEEFNRQKKEKLVRPNMFEFMTAPPSERSDMEKFFLKEAGYAMDEEMCEDDLEYDRLVEERDRLYAH